MSNTHYESMEGTSIHKAYTQKGNNNTKHLAYTALVRPILDYGGCVWDPYRESQFIALNRVQKGAAMFSNKRTWKAIGNRLLKQCYLIMEDHSPEIRTRKERTDVGKYSFLNRIIKYWKKLTGDLLSSFPFKLNPFRQRVKNIVTSN